MTKKRVLVTGASDNDLRWVDIEHARQVIGFVPPDRAGDGFEYD